MKHLSLVFGLLLAMVSQPLFAAIEELSFETPEQEQRYERLIAELRCPKCLNTNLAGSDAPIANDLRQEVYDQIMAGRSDEEIIDFMTARYGDFILYRPPLRPGTLVLWFGPPLLLILGFFIARRLMRRSQIDAADSDADLSPEENRRLQEILSSHPEK